MTEPIRLGVFDLKIISGSKMRPRINQQFFKEDGLEWFNEFEPTEYMKLKGEPRKKPKIILDFLFHLFNYDQKRVDYFLNWLAYFFKFLVKSPVSIVLVGDQGAGKKILFDIISELFGQRYCITINDESLNTRFKAKMFENKLFYNFDEIKYSTAVKNNSVLKGITNGSISLEAKNKNIEVETEIHAQSIYTSNDVVPVQVEESDRRHTIFSTGDNIRHTDFLGFGSYDLLATYIKDDLEDFAKYLKCYDTDKALAKEPMDTPERNLAKNSSNDDVKELFNAIIKPDIGYLAELEEIDNKLYIKVYHDLIKGKIDRADIAKIYNCLFSGRNITTKEILKRFREYKPYHIFSSENMSHSGSNHYFHLR